MARPGVLPLAFLLFVFGATERRALASSTEIRPSAIVGGAEDLADGEVFLLVAQRQDGSRSLCSSTLIGSRTLLTAAHCVDACPDNPGGECTPNQLSASPKPVMDESPQAWLEVVEVRVHPEWRAQQTSQNDLALVLLANPPGVSPKAWNQRDISGWRAEPLRVVGYGTASAEGTGMGTRRSTNLVSRTVDAEYIYLGDPQEGGVCHGDSGGPSFHTFEDNVERLVGVHSFTANSACTDGGDTRVDNQAPFIRTWLEEKEGLRASSCTAGSGGLFWPGLLLLLGLLRRKNQAE